MAVAGFASVVQGIQFAADPQLNIRTGVAIGEVITASATVGFAHIPIFAGIPSGVPTLVAGFAPLAIDSTTQALWYYDGTRWCPLSGGVQSATAVATATAGTIATAGLSVSRVAPAGAVTGVILAVGTRVDQHITVINESVAANTIAFAVQATSHLADGASVTIPGLIAREFIWDTSTSLWYRKG